MFSSDERTGGTRVFQDIESLAEDIDLIENEIQHFAEVMINIIFQLYSTR